DLIDTGEPKSPENLSPREKEKEILQQKKQAEYDSTGAHISNCKEHLLKIIHTKETKESSIQSIKVRKSKLLEERKKLEEEERRTISMKHQLDDIVAEGNDIVKGLEALQDRVRSASSLLGIKMASEDFQRYHMVFQERITSRVKSTIKEDAHMMKEIIICSSNTVSQGVECRREFQVRELLYSCLQCRQYASIKLCGSCFVNSAHLNHKKDTLCLCIPVYNVENTLPLNCVDPAL
ncbi:unnamed protein product, partial [Meganyctiphanes norvegica]